MKERSDREEKLRSLLRDLRSEAGLRQVDLADRLREPQSFVSKYESGERKLDFLEVEDICDALGIPLTELIMRLHASRR